MFEYDFPDTEQKTRVTPPVPFFAEKLEIEMRFQEFKIPITFNAFPPSNPGYSFSIQLEITEA